MSRCVSDADLRSVLEGADDAAAEAHLGDCAVCRERLDALAGAGEGFVAPTEEVRAGSDQLQRVMAGLKEAPLGAPSTRRRWWVFGAIALLAIVAGAMWFRPAPAPVPRAEGPFVVVGGDGFATLAAAVAAARDGDTIEIRTAEVALPDGLDLGEKALTLRASDGFEPSLEFARSSLTHSGPVVLEGLQLMRGLGGGLGDEVLIDANGPLALCHCFIRVHVSPPVHFAPALVAIADGARLDMTHTAIMSRVGRGVLGVGQCEIDVEHSVIAVPTAFDFRPAKDKQGVLRFVRSSFHGPEFVHWLGAAGEIGIEIERSAVDAREALVLSRDPATSVTTQWRGRANLYPPGMAIPPEDIDSATCRMDLRARIRRQTRTGQVDLATQNLLPSAEATRRFPKRGFSDADLGSPGAYQRFRKTDAYREWRDRMRVFHGGD